MNRAGVNGFEHRKQDIYRPTRAELVTRGAHGGLRSGQIRHSSAKWRAVEAALEACKRGAPSWSLLADFYDLAYRAGYGARYNARQRGKGTP